MAPRSKRQQRLEESSDTEQHHDEEKVQEEEAVSGSDAEEEQEEGDEPVSGDEDVEEAGDDDGDSDGSVGVGENDEYPVDEGDADEGDDEELEAVGFGDAMSKILQQNVAEDAAPILAKRTTARMREIQNEKNEIKKDRVGAAEKREKERKDNVVPSHATATKDRQLRKIATKGVVALFNAIAKHQHQTGKIPDKEDKKVKALSKENFLGLLKGTSQKEKPAPAKAEEPKSSWSVLQDDYMMGAKLKDWDATHANNDAGRARRRGNDKDQGDESDPEAAEEKAWKQVGALGSDDEDGAASKDTGSSKRKPRANASTQKKKVKRS